MNTVSKLDITRRKVVREFARLTLDQPTFYKINNKKK